MQKEHYSFVGTLASNLSDPCIANMVLTGLLLNRNTKETYIRTAISTPAVIGDWTLLGSGGGGGGTDKYVVAMSLNTTTNVLTLTRNDNVAINQDLTSLKVPPAASLIPFSNVGTNFIATKVEAAIKELNTSRPWAKVGAVQTAATTNKSVLLTDAIYHTGKIYIGETGAIPDQSQLRIVGGLNLGIGNKLTDFSGGKNASVVLGGYQNEIQNTSDPDFPTGAAIIGGRFNIINGYRIAIINSVTAEIFGEGNTVINSTNFNMSGVNNTVINGFDSAISGIENSVLFMRESFITGSRNTLLQTTSTNLYNASNNVVLYMDGVGVFSNANRNTILKLVSGSVSSDDNLVWGEKLTAAGVNNTNMSNILLGRSARTNGKDSFVWSMLSDPSLEIVINHNGVLALVGGSTTPATFASSANNEFMARFPGGFRLRTNDAGTVGVNLVAGGNSWATVSSILVKDVVADINTDELLSRFRNLQFRVYKYKGEGVHFLSTTAEEWQTAMSGITTDTNSVTNGESLPAIPTNDQINVALVLIQDLYGKLDKIEHNLISLGNGVSIINSGDPNEEI